MGDFLSFLYTVVDSLSLILFLDVFAERRLSDRKFTIGVGCFVALNFWILKVPLIFFHRNQAIKIGMILLSYTFSTRVLYTKISGKLLLLLVGVEYLITYSLSFGLGMWLIAGVGFLAVAFSFIVTFFPPSQLPVGSPAFYTGLVIVGTVVFVGIPILISTVMARRNRKGQ